MKTLNLATVAFLILLPFFAIGQDQGEMEKTYKNEFGTDLTGLIERIFNFNSSQTFNPYTPVYQFIYKRHFNKFSIRAGVGGVSRTTEEEATASFDEGKLKTESRYIFYRIGVEWNSQINKKWNFYYGLDFRHLSNYRYDDNNYYNAGYRYGSERKENEYGLAPLIGIEFKINDRIALATEASFFAYIKNTSNQPIIKQVSDEPSQPFPSTDIEKSSGTGTAFSIPYFIYVTVRI